MRSLRLALCAVLASAVLAAGAASAAEGPLFTIGRDGVLLLGALPDILSRPEVRPHLATGLTTTFALRVTATDETGTKTRGGGRIDVRWEPWDEVFFTAALGADGRARRESLPSLDRLAAWWNSLEIPAATGLAPGGRWTVRVEVNVIPFSASEQRDTQRWFSDSLGQAPPPAPSASSQEQSAAARQVPANGGVLDLLIATSIKRHSLISFNWTALPRTHGREPSS
ncbi:MAG TPA: hypothetical protein VH988_34170 [Thermoanaerobaculia bacterium]|jgi:hypothetical protein|nr:hypothetical protein [Thermoanaerobaculia bacterium]